MEELLLIRAIMRMASSLEGKPMDRIAVYSDFMLNPLQWSVSYCVDGVVRMGFMARSKNKEWALGDLLTQLLLKKREIKTNARLQN